MESLKDSAKECLMVHLMESSLASLRAHLLYEEIAKFEVSKGKVNGNPELMRYVDIWGT